MSQELQPLPTRRTARSLDDTVGTNADIDILWQTLTLLIEAVRTLTSTGGNNNEALQAILQQIEDMQEQINDLQDRVVALEFP